MCVAASSSVISLSDYTEMGTRFRATTSKLLLFCTTAAPRVAGLQYNAALVACRRYSNGGALTAAEMFTWRLWKEPPASVK